jgi:hypothetical protein
MTTYNTGNPVGSAAAQDLYDNAQNLDHLSNDMENEKWPDRLGRDRLTWYGIEKMSQDAIAGYGYITIDSFEDGATLTLPNQVLRLKDSGEYYRWDGSLPKTVPAGSTPESAGGIGAGAWLSVGVGGDAGIIIVNDLSEVTGKFLKWGSIVISNKNGGKYTVMSAAPRNSRLPLIQCSNGYLVPLEVDDGSQFISCKKVQTMTGYQESGSLKAQGVEYDNQRSRAFITSYRNSGADQLTVIREYNLNADGTIGTLISSCENLPFGHSEYVMFENASDGNTYIWGHSGPTFAANAIIRLKWTGSTTGSNTPTVSIPVTAYGAEKPFISWYGYEDSMVIIFPSSMVAYICNLDDLISGNLTPYKIIQLSQYGDILSPRIGQMIKHHGSHFVSLSGYYLNAALGTRTATTYETNALAGSVPDNGQGYNLDLVDTSVSGLNEIQNMGFKWDSASEKFNSFAFSVGADYNLYLYGLTDNTALSSRDKVIKLWNTIPGDVAFPSLAPGRAVATTPYPVNVPALNIGSTQVGTDGTLTNVDVLGDWTATQTQNNATRQEATERFWQAFRNAWYGPSDTLRYMGQSIWDDRPAASQGPLGSTVGGITVAGWSIGHNPAQAQYALNTYKYGLNVQPQTSADYGGIKSSVAGATGRPCFMAGGNQRYAADGTVYMGLYAEATGAWNPLITGTAASVRFNAPIAPIADNSLSNGTAALRWSQIYAGTGSINTSDERYKTKKADITDAVLDAWGKVEYQQFRFTDSVSAKGNDARIHFGVIAQQVKSAFESAGLDPFAYGILCYDEWEDQYETVSAITEVQGATYSEDGEVLDPGVEVVVVPEEHVLVRAAGNIYGIRYEEALILEAALMRRATKRLEDRIAAIESK